MASVQTAPAGEAAATDPRRRRRAIAGCAAAAIIIGFWVVLATMTISLFSPNETSFQLKSSTEPDVIFLPPTSGVIQVRFEPASNVRVSSGFRLSIGDPSVIERCDQGCRIRFTVVDDQIPTQVTISYLAGNSEYVNDIEDMYNGEP